MRIAGEECGWLCIIGAVVTFLAALVLAYGFGYWLG